ncbi:hypothetical protein PUNSTDRAFT_127870 [Punctularia strigosozonata HHB-11173 SS5]|uniref:uncharacterized protein n=1 Tax=Punctularia strigosozonata (strain HHB-11173) TaxID=741275 RepID=UPI00044164D2|nr:uncharacterized protein PUNSTDRAFT_127870 [Punctularia strigosozonata HHB-11173 SS5]EIN05431.1 hypothetical protein PUNSTDRAFT_127870 [Punctularia strigosozonata HHB-11173 SS5]
MDEHSVPHNLRELVDMDALSFVTGTDSTFSGRAEHGHTIGQAIKATLRIVNALPALARLSSKFRVKAPKRRRAQRGTRSDIRVRFEDGEDLWLPPLTTYEEARDMVRERIRVQTIHIEALMAKLCPPMPTLPPSPTMAMGLPDVHFTVTRGKQIPRTTLLTNKNWDKVTQSLKRQEVIDVHVCPHAPVNIDRNQSCFLPLPAQEPLTFRLATVSGDKLVDLPPADDYMSALEQLLHAFEELANIALQFIWLTVTRFVLALYEVFIGPSVWDVIILEAMSTLNPQEALNVHVKLITDHSARITAT